MEGKLGNAMRITPEEYKALMAKRQPEKPNKFRNVKKIVNGLEFDSTKEARHYQDLLAWQQSGQITELERQRPFMIEINGMHVCTFFADFTYVKDGSLIVEDVKSRATKTPVYQLKKKLVKSVLNIDIVEV